jgi:glycosyltransferase involved in cell wall biosynthesis
LQLLKSIKYCFKLASTQKADVVHHLYLERSELPLYFYLIKSKNYSWKVFATLFWPYFIRSFNEKIGVSKHFYYYLNRWALGQLLRGKKLNGLFVHTNRIRDKLLDLYNNNLLKQKIFVVPDPVEPMSEITQRIARKHFGLPQKKPIILFFGGLRWDKGWDILLKTLPLIKDELYILIAGKPYNNIENDIIKYKQLLRNPEHLILHLKYIPEKDITAYFSAVDAIVLPYRCIFKGTSGVLQRAAAAGKPVIASDVGEIGPVIRENNLGILVKPESPESLAKGILEFLTKPLEWRNEVKIRAIRYTKKNHYQKMANIVRKAYISKIED